MGAGLTRHHHAQRTGVDPCASVPLHLSWECTCGIYKQPADGEAVTNFVTNVEAVGMFQLTRNALSAQTWLNILPLARMSQTICSPCRGLYHLRWCQDPHLHLPNNTPLSSNACALAHPMHRRLPACLLAEVEPGAVSGSKCACEPLGQDAAEPRVQNNIHLPQRCPHWLQLATLLEVGWAQGCASLTVLQ